MTCSLRLSRDRRIRGRRQHPDGPASEQGFGGNGPPEVWAVEGGQALEVHAKPCTKGRPRVHPEQLGGLNSYPPQRLSQSWQLYILARR